MESTTSSRGKKKQQKVKVTFHSSLFPDYFKLIANTIWTHTHTHTAHSDVVNATSCGGNSTDTQHKLMAVMMISFITYPIQIIFPHCFVASEASNASISQYHWVRLFFRQTKQKHWSKSENRGKNSIKSKCSSQRAHLHTSRNVLSVCNNQQKHVYIERLIKFNRVEATCAMHLSV